MTSFKWRDDVRIKAPRFLRKYPRHSGTVVNAPTKFLPLYEVDVVVFTDNGTKELTKFIRGKHLLAL